MYESFYGLSANPFRLVPDARFYYDSTGHKRGMDYLRYGLLQGQGFVVVTGNPGTGKSTLVEALFTEMPERSLVVASLVSTNLEADEILQAVVHCFKIPTDDTNKAALLKAIEDFLRVRSSQGKRVILIVDEAQNLPHSSLEELRMLSNFQQQGRSLLQVILLGQHQLNDILSRPDMEQLCQRVIASCHLDPLSAEQTREYIAHRLQCVGWHGQPSISSQALAVVYAVSGGNPRLINIFCDRMFLSASLEGSYAIDLGLAQSVQQELMLESTGSFCGLNFTKTDQLVELEPLPGADFVAVVEQTQDAHKDDLDALTVAAVEVDAEMAQESPVLFEADETVHDAVVNESAEQDTAYRMQHSEAANENSVLETEEDLAAVEDSVLQPAAAVESQLEKPCVDPVTAEPTYKEAEPNTISESPDDDVHQQQVSVKEALKDSLFIDKNKTELNNRGLVWPPVFVSVAMIIMFFFAEDVRDFSQRYTLGDPETLLENAANTNQDEENLMLADASETIFVQEQSRLQPQAPMVLTPTESIDVASESSDGWVQDMQLEVPADLVVADKSLPEMPSKSEMKGHSTPELKTDSVALLLADAVPAAELQAETMSDFRLDKKESSPAPVREKPKAVAPAAAKVAAVSKSESEKVASVVPSVSAQSSKPKPVVKSTVNTVTPVVAEGAAVTISKSNRVVSAVQDIPGQSSKPVPAKPKAVVEVPKQAKNETAVVAMKDDTTDVDIIIPKFDDKTDVEVLQANAMSDLETTASTDLPPVVDIGVAEAGGVTELELTALLNDLVSYYESGDLSGFVGLFAPDAVVDGEKGRESVKKDYQALFDATDKRQMALDALQWQYNQGLVNGYGEFVVTVWRKRGRSSFTQRGVLTLGVEKLGEVLAIKTMAHELK